MTPLTSPRGDSEDTTGLNIQQCWTFWGDTPHAVPPGSETSRLKLQREGLLRSHLLARRLARGCGLKHQCRICRFFGSRHIVKVEKGDRPSKNVKFA